MNATLQIDDIFIIPSPFWARGTDFGESLSIQPAVSVASGGFEIGSWASYGATPESAGVNEHDLWLGYTVETESSGSFSLGVTDYYFPAPGSARFFDFDGDGAGAQDRAVRKLHGTGRVSVDSVRRHVRPQ